ncbi:Regulator of protease activity HflC, stomatin/prohibitin superfamily [Seinonella peptonophila]|uniref:Regulator of protease activity HflC, stomatin/prohibitin superfamily n=1 Tax=Seinonella peptonophila TaxID=112248 RepID=A0A1M4VLX9_9BACL|nr:SPFH domain-containing protein [Seinonella peptonophila]SHE69842.1 Regulator of protease activity HflC, stomatin/prohibitin superfamily [Seinonella peptonophila]
MNHQEKRAHRINGFIMLFLWLILAVVDLVLIGASFEIPAMFVVTILLSIFLIISLGGFILIQPNQARVLTFFGKYTGSVKENGFFWVNPLASKQNISLKIHNFTSDKLKVNDLDGNPILIGAVVVWRVVDTTKALFDVDDYEHFVELQSETAIRTLASRYPYDTQSHEELSLRGMTEEISDQLRQQLQERMEQAGVEIIESRISHLAYAPEIAQAMLRRQQAQAVIVARQKIVEGAMGMVEQALQHLEKSGVVELDEERKASMANNLLVALVSDGEAQPVINTGSLYS